MSGRESAPMLSTLELPRILGVRDGGRRGPLVIVVAGQHGNEPGGVEAALELLADLHEAEVAGRLVVLSGNRAALRRGVRHQGQDLNRLWTRAELAALETRPPSADTPDRAELRELHAVITRELAAQPSREVVLLDLHSTSAGGPGFSVVADAIPSRLLARAVPLPVILGLEERLEGPLLTWMADQGLTAAVFEGGQHKDPLTPRNCLAALWLALAQCRTIPATHPRVAPARSHLERVAHGLPRVMDLSFVHAVTPDDRFLMEPGWRNFMRVCRDQCLALQNGELVQAPLDGYMLMPLYQGLGTEGYFLCRPVSRAWLTASRWLRRTRTHFLLRLLPGIRAVDTTAGECRTDRRLTRPVVAALHLYGYRKRTLREGTEVSWRRKPERAPV
jgi:hypothetical protein